MYGGQYIFSGVVHRQWYNITPSRGRGALIKVLYVFARYAPAAHQGRVNLLRVSDGNSYATGRATFIRHTQQQHSTTFCRAWNAYTWSFMELHILVVELILILRGELYCVASVSKGWGANDQ